MPSNAPLSLAEFRALAAIAQARRQLLTNMFNGTQLKFSRRQADKSARQLLHSGKALKGAAASSPGGGSSTRLGASIGIDKMVQEFMVLCADLDGIEDIALAIGEGALQDLVTEMLPFVGIVSSGAKLVRAGKAVAEDGYHLYKSSSYKQGFLRGDPVAAAEAVQAIIRRDLAKHGVDFSRQGVATGAKIAGLFADLGTTTTAALGMANTLASLGLQLYALGLEVKDLRAGNRRLLTPDSLDLTVFEDCPILGCYLITCADTSAVANFFVADIGLPGWMDRVEQMKRKQMDPLLQIATQAIQASHLQLEGLSTNKGTHHSPSFFARQKSKLMKQLGFA